MPARDAAGGPAVPIELLDDSEAALRRAEGLLAELSRGPAPRAGRPAADAAIAARGLLGLGEDLRRVRVDIDRATGAIAWCLSEARALLDDLQRRVERVARVAVATIPPAEAPRAPGAPAPPAVRGEPSSPRPGRT